MPWEDVEPGLFEEVHNYARASGNTLEEAFRHWATYYQAEFRNLLTWLCRPNVHPPELKAQARRFLTLCVHDERWDIEATDDVSFDESGDRGDPIFYRKRVEYDLIAAPIAKFIFGQMERFQDDDVDLYEALPVCLCERGDCGKFMLPQRRRRKRYCSNLCCALVHQQAKSPEEWRDYMWLHRLESGPLGVVRSKLNRQAVRHRLREIEAHWPRLAAKVRNIRTPCRKRSRTSDGRKAVSCADQGTSHE